MKLFIIYGRDGPMKVDSDCICSFANINQAIRYLKDWLRYSVYGDLDTDTITIKEINTGESKDVKIYKLKENWDLVEEAKSVKFIKEDWLNTVPKEAG